MNIAQALGSGVALPVLVDPAAPARFETAPHGSDHIVTSAACR